MTERSSTLPLLIIVLGPPATGKTTLATRIAAELALPLMTKDMIKEKLGDVLGCAGVELSRRLGHASIVLLRQFAEALVAARRPCVIECNLRRQWDEAPFLDLQQRYPYEALQILCRADPQVVIERYRRRATSGERHFVHLDQLRIPELQADDIRAQCEPLALGGQVIEVDTTDFAALDCGALVARIRAMHPWL